MLKTLFFVSLLLPGIVQARMEPDRAAQTFRIQGVAQVDPKNKNLLRVMTKAGTYVLYRKTAQLKNPKFNNPLRIAVDVKPGYLQSYDPKQRISFLRR